MIDQDEIELIRAMAHGAKLCPPPPDVLRELCRVYAKWLDAPEARAEYEPYVCLGPGELLDGVRLEFQRTGFDIPSVARDLDGKRVRLVVCDD